MLSAQFCSRQYLFKGLIYSTYNEITNNYKALRQKHPDIKGCMTISEHDALSEQAKTDFSEVMEKRARMTRDLVDLVKIYCRESPNEKICSYRHLQTYKECPWRLQQNMDEFVRQLD